MCFNIEIIMKILIWIDKDDAVTGNLDPTNWHLQCPQPNYKNYVQVIITQDEFTRLMDIPKIPRTPYDNPEWLIKQYNRNRAPKDWINDVSEMTQDPQDDMPFGD